MFSAHLTNQPMPACFVANAVQLPQIKRIARSSANIRAEAHQGTSTTDHITSATASSSLTTRRALLASTVIAGPLFSTLAANADDPTRVYFDITVDGQPFGRIVIDVLELSFSKMDIFRILD